MKSHKKILIMLSLCVLISCSKSSRTSSPRHVPSYQLKTTLLEHDALCVSDYLKVYGNLNVRFSPAMAGLFASRLVKTNPNAAIAYLKNYERNHNVSLETRKYVEDYERLKNYFIYAHNDWARHHLRSIVINEDRIQNEFLSLEEQLVIENAASKRSLLLEEINRVYQNFLKIRYQKLAAMALCELRQIDDSRLKKIIANKETTEKSKIKQLRKRLEDFNIFDGALSRLELLPDEKVVAMIYAGVAAEVYKAITSQPINQELSNLSSSIGEAEKVINSMIPILKGIAESRKRLAKGHEDFIASQKLLNEDIEQAINLIQHRLSRMTDNPSSSNAEIMQLLNDKTYQAIKTNLIGNRKMPEESEKTLLSKGIKLNQNLKKVLNSYTTVSSEFLAMVNQTQELVKVSGLDFPDDVVKVIGSVEEVHSTINTANNILSGFEKGGLIGAVTALAESSALSMIVGKNIIPPTPEQILNNKLDNVVRLQKELLDMQFKTMEMVTKLANMVAELHEKEMFAIAELKELALINLDLGYLNLTADLKSCEVLAHNSSNFKSQLDFSRSTHSYKVLKTYVYSMREKLSQLNLINNIFGQYGAYAYQKCRNHLSSEIGFRNTFADTPLLALFADTSVDNIRYHRVRTRIYIPFLEKYKSLNLGKIAPNSGLELPLRSVRDLSQKLDIVSSSVQDSKELFTGHALDHLISTKALQRYLIQIIRLDELFDFGIEDSRQDISLFDIYESSVKANEQPSAVQALPRSIYRALRSAIAQENILAGGPLLKKISDDFSNIRQSFKTCDHAGAANQGFNCAVFFNKLALKNMMTLRLMKTNIQTYDAALKGKDALKLARILGDGITTADIQIEKGRVYLSLTGKNQSRSVVELPRVKKVHKGLIHYSANMKALIQLQDLAASSLVERSELSKYSVSSRDYLKYRILRAQWLKQQLKMN